MRSPEEILQELFARRGVSARHQELLHDPRFEQLTDVERLVGIPQAADLLAATIQAKGSVVVFGDYDADGVPGTALMVRALRRWGVPVEGIIPKRAEGYGLTMDAVSRILAHKPSLVVTVDNGTVAQQEVAALMEHCPVIVCDHHEAHGEEAMATVVCNPKLPQNTSPARELCGAAVAWYLLVATARRLGEDEKQLRWELDLVGLATIADMVPLTEENWLLARYGLEVLRKSRNEGLRALAAAAGVDLGTLSAGDVGFKLAPRLNAPSRMHAELVDGRNAALELLCTDVPAQAGRHARYLSQQNEARQRLVEAHLAEARVQATQDTNAVLVVFHPQGSTGVIGLVASRLAEETGKSVVALAPEDGVVKGSVRTVGKVHALELLAQAEEVLDRYGGHAKAAGLSVKSGAAVQRLRELVQPAQVPEPVKPKVDMKIGLEEASLDLVQAMDVYAPWGVGFTRPVFEVEANLVRTRRAGAQSQHLLGELQDGSVRRRATWFSAPATVPEGAVVVRATLEHDDWGGRNEVAVRIVGLV